jgi:hypothetical protein
MRHTSKWSLEENQAKLSVTTPHRHLGDIAVLLCPFLISAVSGQLQAQTAVCKFRRRLSCLHSTMSARCHVCTVPCLHGATSARYHVCKVPRLHGATSAQYHVCTVPCLHGAMSAQYHVCTVPRLHGAVSACLQARENHSQHL